MFHKIKKVEPLNNYLLLLSFENGEQKKYDVKQLFNKWHQFQSLSTTQALFEQVKIDANGYGISWNDELDLSSNELYQNSLCEHLIL